MTTVAAPPRPPSTDDPEALFEEARHHRRQRWLRLVVLTAAVLAAGVGAYAVLGGGSSAPLATTPVLKNGVLTSVPNQTVVLVVDVSGSMRATDVKPTRLDATVAAMRTFIDRLPKRFEVGLVAFSTTGEVLQAPTRDRRLVLRQLDYLSPEAATALGDGLAIAVTLTVDTLARQGIRRAPGHYLPAVIVLQSDGAQTRGANTPLQAATQANAAGIRVASVAVGTPGGRVEFGVGVYKRSVAVPPDPKAVAQIARVTHGQSFTAPTAERLESIYSGLASTISR